MACGSSSSQPSGAEYSKMARVSSVPAVAAAWSWLRTRELSSPALDMAQTWPSGRAMVVLETAAHPFKAFNRRAGRGGPEDPGAVGVAGPGRARALRAAPSGFEVGAAVARVLAPVPPVAGERD